MKSVDVPLERSVQQGPSFKLSQRLHRVLWRAVWIVLASWTPASFSPWRIQLLKLFGAKIHPGAAVAATVKIWLPRNLELGPNSALGPGVDCYNMGLIRIGANVVVSQRAVLCGGTHDIHDERFQLKVAPITIGDYVWIASEAFVGPGVHIANGCVLGARGCAFSDLDAWTVYRGNPAVPLKERRWRNTVTPVRSASGRTGTGPLLITCVLGAFQPVPPVRGGSVERIWQTLCEQFAACGHTVTLISRKFPDFPDRETINGVHYIRLASTDTPKSTLLYRLLDVVFSFRVCMAIPKSDITITNSVSLPLMLARRRAGKIYMSIARFPKHQFGFYRRVDRMQPVSSHVGEAICVQSPNVAHLVKAIPNAISNTFAGVMSKDWGPRSAVILYVGRVAHEKGLDLLIRAYARVPARFTDWRLVILGPHSPAQGGSGEDYLRELKAMSESLGAKVEFIGPVYDERELARWLKTSEIFVYPSVAAKGEALPLAPVEAMACGCSVILSALDCFNDYLEDGVNGLAFDQNDASGTDLACKLERLMNDASLRHALGEAAVSTARRFTREVVAEEFLADFQSLRSQRP